MDYWCPRVSYFMSWLLSWHLRDLKSNSFRHDPFAWASWMQWSWKFRNPMECHPHRQVTTWNLLAREQISRHGSSHSISETSDQLDCGMSHLPELGGCNGVENLEIQWMPTKRGRPWREIFVLKTKFHIMAQGGRSRHIVWFAREVTWLYGN